MSCKNKFQALGAPLDLTALLINTPLTYLNKNQPDFIYIAYGETDDFAHNGEYDSYLKAAKNTDQLIKDLWSYTQNNSYYKGKTIFFITTDHGRGTAPIDSWKKSWRKH
jgi:bisphosphoglycerate-independent phosphoglycerate mutase (AlkP superfamily)